MQIVNALFFNFPLNKLYVFHLQISQINCRRRYTAFGGSFLD